MLDWLNKRLGFWVARWVAPGVSMEVRRELDLDNKLKALDKNIRKKIDSLDVPKRKESHNTFLFQTFANGEEVPLVQRQSLRTKTSSK